MSGPDSSGGIVDAGWLGTTLAPGSEAVAGAEAVRLLAEDDGGGECGVPPAHATRAVATASSSSGRGRGPAVVSQGGRRMVAEGTPAAHGAFDPPAGIG